VEARRRAGVTFGLPPIKADPVVLGLLVMTICLLVFSLLFETSALLQLIFALFGLAYLLSMGGFYPFVSRTFVSGSVSAGLLGALVMICLQAILGTIWGLQIPTKTLLLLTAPVVEEVFFRGFVMNFQLQMYPYPDPMYLTVVFTTNSILFSLFHVGTALLTYGALKMSYFAVIFISGYLLCFLAWQTKGLLAPIISHFIINLLALKAVELI